MGLGVGYGAEASGKAELERRIGYLEEQLNKLQSQINEKDCLLATLKSRIEVLNREIDVKNCQFSMLQSRVRELQAENENLKKLLAPIQKGAWNLIASFTASSGFTTDYFYVPGKELRINWTWTSTKPEFARAFDFSLCKEGEIDDIYEKIGIKDNQGTTYVHNVEPANYYLDVDAIGIDKWTITIEVWIPR